MVHRSDISTIITFHSFAEENVIIAIVNLHKNLNIKIIATITEIRAKAVGTFL
jgi:hypothetical protein